jgi:hypothetical protein
MEASNMLFGTKFQIMEACTPQLNVIWVSVIIRDLVEHSSLGKDGDTTSTPIWQVSSYRDGILSTHGKCHEICIILRHSTKSIHTVFIQRIVSVD